MHVHNCMVFCLSIKLEKCHIKQSAAKSGVNFLEGYSHCFAPYLQKSQSSTFPSNYILHHFSFNIILEQISILYSRNLYQLLSYICKHYCFTNLYNLSLDAQINLETVKTFLFTLRVVRSVVKL